jgi:hypothetical protein
MDGPHLTKLLPLALSFILSKWLTTTGGWGWKLAESTSI